MQTQCFAARLQGHRNAASGRYAVTVELLLPVASKLQAGDVIRGSDIGGGIAVRDRRALLAAQTHLSRRTAACPPNSAEGIAQRYASRMLV